MGVQPWSYGWYIAWGVVNILCFWPLAIVQFVYADKANTAYLLGDMYQFEANRRRARTFGWICSGIGMVFFMIGFLGGVASSLSGSGY